MLDKRFQSVLKLSTVCEKSKQNFSGDNFCDSKLDTYNQNTERLARTKRDAV